MLFKKMKFAGITLSLLFTWGASSPHANAAAPVIQASPFGALSGTQRTHIKNCFNSNSKTKCTHGESGSGYEITLIYNATTGKPSTSNVGTALPVEGCYNAKMERAMTANGGITNGKCDGKLYPFKLLLRWRTQCSAKNGVVAANGSLCSEGANVIVTPEIITEGDTKGLGSFTLPIAPEIPLNSKTVEDQAKESCGNMTDSGFTWDTTGKICRKKARFVCEQELKMIWVPKVAALKPDEEGSCSAGLALCSAVPVNNSGTVTVENLSGACTNGDYCNGYNYAVTGTAANGKKIPCQCTGTSLTVNKLGKSCTGTTSSPSPSASPTSVFSPSPSPTIICTPTPPATSCTICLPGKPKCCDYTPSSGECIDSHKASVFLSGTTSCAIATDGSLKCWGKNTNGQIGDGTTTDRLTPVSIGGITFAVQGDGGDQNNCIVEKTGQLKCWPVSGVRTPVSIAGATDAKYVSTSWNFTCYVTAGGNVKCLGSNSYGQLGNGTWSDSSTPVTVSGLTGVSTVSSKSGGHSCALKTDGAVYCWGLNDHGQLGNGNKDNKNTPQYVSLGGKAIDVTTSGSMSCAVLENKTTRCWGGFTNDSSNDFMNPQTITGITNANQITAGTAFSCSQHVDKSVKCWGTNIYGQLGNGTINSPNYQAHTSQVSVTGITDSFQIETGRYHSCSLLNSCGIRCWGLNSSDTTGALGNGTSTSSATPVTVTGIDVCPSPSPAATNKPSIFASEQTTCIINKSKQVKCWGYAQYTGALGTGAWEDRTTPSSVIVSDAVQGDGGYLGNCVVLSNGYLSCWGTVSNILHTTTPTLQFGVIDAKQVSVSRETICYLTVSGTVKCKGTNNHGQLGNGTWSDSSSFVDVLGLSNITKITSSTAIDDNTAGSCALRNDGKVFCWGYGGNGAIGDGTYDSKNNAYTEVSGISNAIDISAHGDMRCAVLSDNTVTCWGAFRTSPSLERSTTPVAASGMTNISHISGGDVSTFCGKNADGSGVKCWGDNSYYGYRGDGSTSFYYTNTANTVVSLSNVQSMDSGGTHSCAILNDCSVKCWGKNSGGSYGALGNGSSTDSGTPVTIPGLNACD
jgi:alpha-tubulin suppressor-like RCC1 family protein